MVGKVRLPQQALKMFHYVSHGGFLCTVAPTLLATLVLLVVPGLLTVWMSLFSPNLTFAGYNFVLHDERFARSAWRTWWYTTTSVAMQMLIGVVAAVLVHRLQRSRLISFALFLPYAVPSIVAVVMWRFLIEEKGSFSLLMAYLFGLAPESWMGDRILFSLILVSVWQFTPFVFLVVLARLRQIPPGLYRSAAADGASIWQQFRRLTWELMLPTVLATGFLRAAFMVTKFDTPWLLAGRTSNEGISTIPIYIYDNRLIGFSANGSPGVAAAVMMALLLGGPLLFGWRYLQASLEARE
jgi:multiple sugar transport system permease protein